VESGWDAVVRMRNQPFEVKGLQLGENYVTASHLCERFTYSYPTQTRVQ
jgi:hypothetical protein